MISYCLYLCRYGDSDENESNIPKEIQETLDLALHNALVEMPKVVPFYKVTYRFHLGNALDQDVEVLMNDSALHSKTRHVNQDELELLKEITDLLDIQEKKEKKHIAHPPAESIENTLLMGHEEDEDSDIFEDAGADYVFEPRVKDSVLSDHPTQYFKDEENIQEVIVETNIPQKTGLEDILEKSRKMKQELEQDIANDEKIEKKTADSHSSDSENSMHMLEEVAEDDGVNYDYDYFYSDNEEEEKKVKPVAQESGARINQDFQKMSKIYERKFGESLQDETKSASVKKRKGNDKESSRKIKQTKKK